jgi:hypothetical protein
MSLIVDCYNVPHAPMPPMLAGLDEGGLCVALARSRWAERPMTVVADGRPKPLGVAESPVDGVELLYAGLVPGGHRDADGLIISLINAHSAPRRLTVVSSDRQIRAAARRRRAKDLDSDTFIERLTGQLSRRGAGPPRPGRPHFPPLPPELVDRWRDAFGIPPEE